MKIVMSIAFQKLFILYIDRINCMSLFIIPFSIVAMTILKLEVQWAEPVSLTLHSALQKPNTEPSIGTSHHVLVHLAQQFQRRTFLEIDHSETRIACVGRVCKQIGAK
jgi:hypothetical protein